MSMNKKTRSLINTKYESQRIYYQRREIKKKDKQIQELTNNWNELEKRVKEYINKNDNWYNNELSTHDKRYYGDSYYTKNAVLMTILDKMKEIKEGKDND